MGLSRGIGRGHLARAMVEAMAFQVGDVTAAMARSGTRPTSLRVDGGASQMDLLLQLTADQSRNPVVRPASIETTAIGAATLAGLAEGLWTSVRELAGLWEADARFEPVSTGAEAEAAQAGWLRAVERSRRWHR